MMYCPNCATPAPNQQKFCRRCGQDLNMVVQVIKGQSVVEAWNRAAALWGLILLIGGAAVGSVLKILSKEGIHLGGAISPYLQALAVVAALGGMGLMMYAFLPAMKVQRLTPPGKPTDKPTDKLADTQPDLLTAMPATIIEHTTELLEDETRIALPTVASPGGERS